MQRFSNSALTKAMNRHHLHDGYNRMANGTRVARMDRPCDVFINHRSIDTKKTFSGLLFQYLSLLDVKCFLDSKSMKPGDRLFDNIDQGIHGCKVGVAVLSPRYCESAYCLHELALMMDLKKRVIPVFYDVKPSELRVVNRGTYSSRDLQRYDQALKAARKIVGLTFDSSQQDWSELLRDATKAVIKNLMDVEEEEAWSRNLSNPTAKNPN